MMYSKDAQKIDSKKEGIKAEEGGKKAGIPVKKLEELIQEQVKKLPSDKLVELFSQAREAGSVNLVTQRVVMAVLRERDSIHLISHLITPNDIEPFYSPTEAHQQNDKVRVDNNSTHLSLEDRMRIEENREATQKSSGGRSNRSGGSSKKELSDRGGIMFTSKVGQNQGPLGKPESVVDIDELFEGAIDVTEAVKAWMGSRPDMKENISRSAGGQSNRSGNSATKKEASEEKKLGIAGLGVLLVEQDYKQVSNTSIAQIKDIFPGSPAVGIDRLYKNSYLRRIDGEWVCGSGFDRKKIVRLLRGEPGTTIVLELNNDPNAIDSWSTTFERETKRELIKDSDGNILTDFDRFI